MAYYLTRIEFENSIPSLKEIKTIFKRFTGFELSIIGHLSLKNIDSKIENVTEAIVNDYEKVKAHYDEKIKVDELPFEEIGNYTYQNTVIKNEDNYIENLSFYHKDFYEIEFEKKGNSLEILWMANHKYFRIALQKTLYTLNNQRFEKNKPLPKSLINKFKKLKKWGEYRWYNRPRK